MSGGFSCQPQSALAALERRNVFAFRDAVEAEGNAWAAAPLHATLLDLACQHADAARYVSILLEYGADPNLVNSKRGRAPIHFAAEKWNYNALKILLQQPNLDVNILDKFGCTALQVAIRETPENIPKHCQKQCLQILLNQPNLDVNHMNRKGLTATHMAISNDNKEAVILLLESGRIDLDKQYLVNNKSLRNVIIDKYPDLAAKLPISPIVSGRNTEESSLFQCLYFRNCDEFTRIAENINQNDLSKVLNTHDGNWTLLQYSCSNGLYKAVKYLLANKADPNSMAPSKQRLPSLLAAAGAYYQILQEILRQDSVKLCNDNGETVLHAVIRDAIHDANEKIDVQETERYRCFRLLLEHTDKYDINAADEFGNTALHLAANNGINEYTATLLQHGAYIGSKNKLGILPLKNITSSLLKEFLDSCISTNGEFPRDDKFEIRYDYKCLIPPTRPAEQGTLETSPLSLEDGSSASIQSSGTSETEPLLYISRNPDLRPLLKHPIFTSFLDLKWRDIRPIFYVNLTFYGIFVLILTAYILFIYDYAPVAALNSTETNASTPFKNNHSSSDFFTGIIWAILLLLLIAITLRELFQFIILPKRYVTDPENYMEILLIICSVLILFCTFDNSKVYTHLSAITVLLLWAELVLLVGRHPQLATNTEMLKTVSKNFLRFLAWYFILIFAFALSFYTLFRSSEVEDNIFLSPGSSFFKTVVMLTGEFDASDIPFNNIIGTSHIVFVLFVFLVAIVLFNLLNGLAVSDTQAIKDDAELVGYVSRVKLTSYTELMMLGEATWWSRSSCLSTCSKAQRQTEDKMFSFTRCPILMRRVKLSEIFSTDTVIRVLPNQGGCVLFDSDKKYISNITETPRCSNNAACCRNYYLDEHVIKSTLDILQEREKKDEMATVQSMIENISAKVNSLEDRFNNLEIYSKRTQVTLEEIINLLKQKGQT